MRRIRIQRGLDLAVEDAGTGSAVLLLHGWPVTRQHWRYTIPALVAVGLRPIAVDLPGLGASSPYAGPFDKQTLSRIVVQLLDRLDVRSVAVIGHDWGATLGYLIAAEFPQRVTRLVAEEELLPGVSASVPEPGARQYPTWHGPFLRAPGLAEALVPGREDAFYGMFLRQSAGPTPLPDDAITTYLAAYRTPAALATSIGYYRTSEPDSQAVLRSATAPLEAPVLTIGGEFGMGRGVAESFGKVARHVEHRQVADAGHYPAEQQPETVNAMVIPFLAGASSRR